MKGHANWSGRVPRTTEQAFGPGQAFERAPANPDTVWHLLLACLLMVMIGLMLGWPL